MNLDSIRFQVGACNGDVKRVVIAQLDGDEVHRSTVNTNSFDSRRHFLKQLAEKIEADAAELVKRFDQRLIHLADQADAAAETDANLHKESGEAKGEGGSKSQATILVELVIEAKAQLFHDPDGNAYARFRVEDHLEVARINSSSFKRWISRLYFEKTGKAPNSQAKADAAGVLEGKAVYDGQELPVYVRLAGDGDRIFLDLCNDKWQVVEIDALGWRVLDESPVMFRRAKAMLPLPAPVQGGSIDLLRQFIFTDDNSFVLIVAWLIGAFRPHGPYAVLELDGEQGSGKSTRAKMLRMLIDPNTADLRGDPRDARDLVIAANNGHVVALDNLSHLPPWLSDCLCRLASGGGFGTRTLYENDEETIFSATRPVILGGIEQVASRGDLIDRSLLVSLQAILAVDRQTEAKLWKDFDGSRPAILGALLTAVSTALRNLPIVAVPALPRMADFAVWVIAAEPALGWEPGTFLRTYLGNREEADALAIESSQIGKVLLETLEECGDFEGTATELLKELERRAGLEDSKRKPKGWPGNARALSGAIKHIAPHLRKIGWDYVSWREQGRGRGRRMALRKSVQTCVRSVRSVQNPDNSTGNSESPRTQADENWPHRTQTDPRKRNDRTQTDAADANLPPLSEGEGEGEVGEV